ncbi:MAG TPA: enoyl-CoA hydratase-related protein, partial [Acidisphaera sp.]|nr:enoyl-CoA hydratase-related protein [Acidisphaera sp.]
FILCGAGAKFALSETSLGLVPAQIAPHVVARVGLATAKRLALTAARLDGTEAVAIGLADSAHTDAASVDAALATLLDGIGRCAPGANAATKRLLAEASRATPEFITHAADVFAESLTGEEGREGIAAFAERRKPRWTSR